MAYVPHLRVTMTGTMGPGLQGVEEFSWGFQLGRGGGGLPAKQDLLDVANSIASIFNTTLAGASRPAMTLRRVRVSDIATTGRTHRAEDGSYNHADALVTGPGTLNGAQYPTQIALVVGLYTGLNDLTGRGRFFLPMPGQTLQADLRISSNDAAAVADQAKTFLNSAGAASVANGFGGPVLASQGSVSRGIPAANRPITGLRVGRVLDTMRSRRAQLQEEPQIVAL